MTESIEVKMSMTGTGSSDSLGKLMCPTARLWMARDEAGGRQGLQKIKMIVFSHYK